MLKIGITGGIGSGKTIVCKLFAASGAPVYNADEAAKRLMHENDAVIEQLISLFGNIYDENNNLLRSLLAEKVFGKPHLLEQLNNIVHPAVIADYNTWENVQTFPYIIRESAILFESSTNKGLDYIIIVTAPEALRIKRVQERDNRTPEQINEIIQRQMPEKEKKALADFVIINDEIQPLLPQVQQLHEKFLNGKQ